MLASRSGSGGGVSRAPMYVQMMPPRSTQGYATARTLCLKLLSGGSLGMSTQQLIVLFAQHEKSSLASLSAITAPRGLVHGPWEGRESAFRASPELFPQPSRQRCQFILYVAQPPLYLMRSLHGQVAFVA